MIAVHIVSSGYPPQPGGLQAATAELAQALQGAGMRPIVYVCEPAVQDHGHPGDTVEVVDIAALVEPWIGPLRASDIEERIFVRDRQRVTFACLRTEIERRMSRDANILLSNFVTTVGFTAHLVAEHLALPHIAIVAGTDFSRGLRNSQERAVFREVCAGARLVVAKSEEQRAGIAQCVDAVRIAVIETSVDQCDQDWRPPADGPLRIFSDGGFSSKKGTGVLLDACAALQRDGTDIHLEICGGDHPNETAYWSNRRRELAASGGLSTAFPGHVGVDAIAERLGASHIYASATLGEGSSAARARALCVGTPMVTTRCGELSRDPVADHVRLVPVGDAAGFAHALRALAGDIRAGTVVPDRAAIARFRRRFDRAAEWARWVDVIRQEATAHG